MIPTKQAIYFVYLFHSVTKIVYDQEVKTHKV